MAFSYGTGVKIDPSKLTERVNATSHDPHFYKGQKLTILEDGFFEVPYTSTYKDREGKEQTANGTSVCVKAKNTDTGVEEWISISMFKIKSKEDRGGETITNDPNKCATDLEVAKHEFHAGDIITYTTKTYQNYLNRRVVFGVFKW